MMMRWSGNWSGALPRWQASAAYHRADSGPCSIPTATQARPSFTSTCTCSAAAPCTGRQDRSVRLVRTSHHYRGARRIQMLARGSVDLVARDCAQQIRQPQVVVETKPEELGVLQKCGNAGV